jgi:hypothetical protein
MLAQVARRGRRPVRGQVRRRRHRQELEVDTGGRWLVHAGDAYFHRSVLERGDATASPWALRWIERFIAVDYQRVRANHRLLAQLAQRDDVTVFSAHDPVEHERLCAGGLAPALGDHRASAGARRPDPVPKLRGR